MDISVLVFLVRKDSALLGKRKLNGRFGKWRGFGGGYEKSDGSILNTAAREFKEETGLTVFDLQRVGCLNIQKPNRSLLTHIFVAHSWRGKFVKSEEMSLPKWFKFSEIPYRKMWEDARIWLPQILLGRKLKVEIIIGRRMNLRECSVKFTQTGRR